MLHVLNSLQGALEIALKMALKSRKGCLEPRHRCSPCLTDAREVTAAAEGSLLPVGRCLEVCGRGKCGVLSQDSLGNAELYSGLPEVFIFTENSDGL